MKHVTPCMGNVRASKRLQRLGPPEASRRRSVAASAAPGSAGSVEASQRRSVCSVWVRRKRRGVEASQRLKRRGPPGSVEASERRSVGSARACWKRRGVEASQRRERRGPLEASRRRSVAASGAIRASQRHSAPPNSGPFSPCTVLQNDPPGNTRGTLLSRILAGSLVKFVFYHRFWWDDPLWPVFFVQLGDSTTT